jgi:hypothetical protein
MTSFENKKKNDSFSLGLPPENPKEKDINDAINSFVHESVVTLGVGASHYCKLLFRRPIVVTALTALAIFIFYRLTIAGVLYYCIPDSFGVKVYDWIFFKVAKMSVMAHFSVLFSPFALSVFGVLGLILLGTRHKYEKIFLNIGLKNHQGGTPKLISIRKLDKHRKEYLFDLNYTSIKPFKDKQDELEGAFKCSIESIKQGKSHHQVKLILTPHKLEEKVNFEDLQELKGLPYEGFYLGKSLEGVRTQRLEALPHMMIAGATNTGKSVFFKQAILGLLQSSTHLQMYLIDLKNGLEFSDFKSAPNVLVYKEVNEAVTVLKEVREEMRRRFEYMEEKGIKKIVPGRDKFDRIVIAIDEASVIYSIKKTDPDYKQKLLARDITDDLAKLSRAAAINLIFATQKIVKEVIPTNIQENISARMAFKANTLQGSLIVVGNKDAAELPAIQGRGIWNFGAEREVIQAPYISSEVIKDYCTGLKEEYHQGHKKMFQKLIGTAKKLEDGTRFLDLKEDFKTEENDESDHQ